MDFTFGLAGDRRKQRSKGRAGGKARGSNVNTITRRQMTPNQLKANFLSKALEAIGMSSEFCRTIRSEFVNLPSLRYMSLKTLVVAIRFMEREKLKAEVDLKAIKSKEVNEDIRTVFGSSATDSPILLKRIREDLLTYCWKISTFRAPNVTYEEDEDLAAGEPDEAELEAEEEYADSIVSDYE
jgi:hypothetical protein